MHRLWKLAPWRIDPVSIEFPNNAFRFDGGYATVVRGLLGSSTGDIRDQVWESSSETRHNDEERAEGQEWQSDGERQWLKVGSNQALLLLRCTAEFLFASNVIVRSGKENEI